MTLLECVHRHQADVDGYYDAIWQLAGTAGRFWDPELKAWVVVRHQHCVELLNDARLTRRGSGLPEFPQYRDLFQFANSVLSSQMIALDPPTCTARRRYWSKYLRSYEGLARLAESSLDSVPAGEFDAYGLVLQPYVSRAIAVRLGLSESERAALYPLIAGYVDLFDGKLASQSQLIEAVYCIAALYAKTAASIQLPAQSDSDRHALVSDFLLMLVAGHESVAYLLGAMLLRDRQTPEFLMGARNRPQIEALITEALRLDSPVQLIGRHVKRPFSLDQTEFVEGERVFFHVGAANRDPDVFEQPGSLLVGRKPHPILSFGMGGSACIGRGFAIEEAAAFLLALADSPVRVAVDATRVEWRNGLAGRGFARIPARCTPRN